MKNSREMTIEAKAAAMRMAFGKLAGEYIAEGQLKKSAAVQAAITDLDPYNESLAKLYDILDQTGGK